MPGKKTEKRDSFVRDKDNKAVKADIGNLGPLTVFKRVFQSGKTGFSGQVQDINTGKRYQITAAVEIAK